MLSKDTHLSLTLFGLCINELNQMFSKVVKEEGVEEGAIGNVVIMLLLYVDDVVLFANTFGDALKLLRVFEEFACILSVNSSKAKIMPMKSPKKKDKPCIMYHNYTL